MVTLRLKGAVVVFDGTMKENEAEVVMNAIRMIKGVRAVTEVEDTTDETINRELVVGEVRELVERLIERIDRLSPRR